MSGNEYVLEKLEALRHSVSSDVEDEILKVMDVVAGWTRLKIESTKTCSCGMCPADVSYATHDTQPTRRIYALCDWHKAHGNEGLTYWTQEAHDGKS